MPQEGRIEVWVWVMDGKPVRTTAVEHIDEDGARVRVPAGRALEPATEGLLQLTELPSSSAIVVPIMAGHPQDVGNEQVADLYFIDGSELSEDDSMKIRRRAVRFVPAPDEIEVVVRSGRPGGREWLPVDVVDLSSGGMAIELAIGQEPTTPFTSGTFRIGLPGRDPVVLEGVVCNRKRRTRELVRYGFAFERSRNPTFDRDSHTVGAWVQARREALASRVRVG